MSKVHWRIRLDTWLGYMFNMITGGKFSKFIKDWYNHKYPDFDRFDTDYLPPFVFLNGVHLFVEEWNRMEGIDLPVAVIDSCTVNAVVVLDAAIEDKNNNIIPFEYIIMTTALMEVLTEDEGIAVLHHEMRHANRHWFLMIAHARIFNKVIEKTDRLALAVRLNNILYAPFSWLMEFDADRVPKEFRPHLANALVKIVENDGYTVRGLVGATSTHPPISVRARLLKK